MAIFLAQMKPLCRRDGRSAVAAAAYRAGDRLEDERTGLVHDYSRRSGVTHAEIFTPDGGPAERAQLWNAAELAEKRKDARTGREWVLALPAELDAEQRRELARAFASEIVGRYGVAVDLAIHEPGKEGDERNHHAHVFATTRQVSRDERGALALGGKAALELSDAQRRAAGLGPAAEEVTALRQLWERLANEALERAGRAERIDSRSLEAQGIDREPTAHLGPAATAMERRGEPSHLGEQNRQIEARNAEREAVQAEIIDLKAERDRRAKEAEEDRERKKADAKAKAEADSLEEARQERAAWEAMSAKELAQEIERIHPPDLAAMVETRPEVERARKTSEALAARRLAAEQRRERAYRAADAWRQTHPLLSRAYDLGLLPKPMLALHSHERTLTQATKELEGLRPQHDAAEGELFKARSVARVDALQTTRAARERVEAMEPIRDRKALEERAKASRAERERQRAERRDRDARAQEKADEDARKAAERETAQRKAEAKRQADRKAKADQEAADKRQRKAEAEAFKADPVEAQKERDRLAAALIKLPEGPERERARQHLKEFEEITGTRERSRQEIDKQQQIETIRKMLATSKERKAREKDRGGDRDR